MRANSIICAALLLGEISKLFRRRSAEYVGSGRKLPTMRGYCSRKRTVKELSDILKTATSAIEPMYFRLNVGGGHPVYRECYEL
jgi:hypothetical protein